MMQSKKLKRLSKKNSTGAMLKRVQNFATMHSLWEKGERFIIGVSGGPDSVCLVHILATLKDKYDFKLHIVHINYRLRSGASDRDEASVKALGKQLNLPVSVYRPRTPQNPSENTLRRIRYDRFEAVRKRLGFTALAVGHTKNDQAETLLLHLLRGSGLQGLSAMKPKNGKILRPLLHIERSEILTYLKNAGLSYCHDHTNTLPVYLRNAVRLKLLPYIAKNFQPRVINVLARSAETLAEDYAYIENNAPSLGNPFSVSALLAQHSAIQRIMLRNLVHKKLGPNADISSANIQELLKMCRSSKNKIQTVQFHGLKFTRRGDRVAIRKNAK